MLINQNERNMKKIAILKGGWSSERSVSLRSGTNVAGLFRDMGYDTYEIDVVKDLKFITTELYRIDPDYIYNVLHGTGGEDGVIQGVLEIFGKPYSNSGVISSAICFDKSISRKLAKLAGVRVPNSIDLTKKDLANIDMANPPMEYPFVLKPCSNGSSVGVFIVHSGADLEEIQKTEWIFGEELLIEEYIKGREFTLLVLDGKTLGSLEITYKNEFYDYASKYDKGGSAHIVDYHMPTDEKNAMYRMAEDAYKACKCKGVVRVDFRYDGNAVYMIELNTQPGMTNTSLVPDIAAYNNIPIKRMLEIE